jgi:hypothetical protein
MPASQHIYTVFQAIREHGLAAVPIAAARAFALQQYARHPRFEAAVRCKFLIPVCNAVRLP